MRNPETNVDDILYTKISLLFNRYPAPLGVNGVLDLTPLGVNGIPSLPPWSMNGISRIYTHTEPYHTEPYSQFL